MDGVQWIGLDAKTDWTGLDLRVNPIQSIHSLLCLHCDLLSQQLSSVPFEFLYTKALKLPW